MEAMSPKIEERTNHPAPLRKSTQTGRAHARETGKCAEALLACSAGVGDDMTLMESNGALRNLVHSNSLGCSGALVATAVALATRASRFDRPAAGS